jgi:hypothetical protein
VSRATQRVRPTVRVNDRVTVDNIRLLGHQSAYANDDGVLVQNLGGLYYQPAAEYPVDERVLLDGTFRVVFLGSEFALENSLGVIR